MKRKLFYATAGLGVLLWLWIGSYIGFRENRPHPWSRTIYSGYLFVSLPEWAEPLKPLYRPLVEMEYHLTGTRVEFYSARVHIGATANF